MTRVFALALSFVLSATAIALPAPDEESKPTPCKVCQRLAKLTGSANPGKVNPERPHAHRATLNGAIKPSGTPQIDLNEVRVRVLWLDGSKRPALTAKGSPVLKIGQYLFNQPGEKLSELHPVWKQLRAKLIEFKHGYKGGSPHGLPVIFDAQKHVSAKVLLRTLSVIEAALGKIRHASWSPQEAIILEEVETPRILPKGKNLDSTSVVDAYGVGGGAAGAYGGRWGKGNLAREGGSPGTESAVVAALRWLKFHQSRNGSWDSDGWTANCSKGKCTGASGTQSGDARYDVGLTSLAILAYVGNGHTHRSGAFKSTVRRAIKWLKRQQKAEGSIGYDRGETFYNHAIATQALCEVYAVTRDFTLKRYAEKAVEFSLKAQNPKLGWQYGVRAGKNDSSVTGWMVAALKAAKKAELKVPDEAFTGARRWFVRATDKNGDVGYNMPGGGSSFLPATDGRFAPLPVNTAISVWSRILMGERRSEDDIRKGARKLLENKPSWTKGAKTDRCNFYYWYQGTNALFQVGGTKWKDWNKAMQKALLPTQRMGGCEDGSWDGVGEWCLAGGRVYATAINALTLETYYRFMRAQSN
ncbi:MAG: terpene cyclase/mutase family protein [Planctomycetes bacterium]|nr:terpene cyclase/mutase family protein [Planctomycetota bacterium]